MPLVAETSTPAAADPAFVWELLRDPRTWTRWWKDCRSVRVLDHKPLREGSPLEVLIQPRQTKITFHPEVDLMTEGKVLSLTQRRFLLRGTVAWTLGPHEMGVKISARGVFKGPLTFMHRTFKHEETLRMTLHRSIRGLKRTAEMAG